MKKKKNKILKMLKIMKIMELIIIQKIIIVLILGQEEDFIKFKFLTIVNHFWLMILKNMDFMNKFV